MVLKTDINGIIYGILLVISNRLPPFSFGTNWTYFVCMCERDVNVFTISVVRKSSCVFFCLRGCSVFQFICQICVLSR